MTDGYWRGNISREQMSEQARATSPVSGPRVAPTVDVAAPPEAPPSFGASSNLYWQGGYSSRGQGETTGDYAAPVQHAGSVSARARQAYAAEALRQKDHVAAGLLAIFLGIFGVHKFYLGCNQAGFIMLAVSIIGGIFTLGLAAAVIEVISIIEGIIYLTKSQTGFDQIYVLNQRDWF